MQLHLDAAGVAAWRIHRHRAEVGEDLLEVRMQVPAAKSRDVQRIVTAQAAAAIAVKRRARNTVKYNGNTTEMQRRERVCCAYLSWFKFSMLLGAMCS